MNVFLVSADATGHPCIAEVPNVTFSSQHFFFYVLRKHQVVLAHALAHRVQRPGIYGGRTLR